MSDFHKSIYHLCYSSYVFESIGFSENDGWYTYKIHTNFGDFYKVAGVQKNVGKLKFIRLNSDVKTRIDLYTNLDLEELQYGINILKSAFIQQFVIGNKSCHTSDKNNVKI